MDNRSGKTFSNTNSGGGSGSVAGVMMQANSGNMLSDIQQAYFNHQRIQQTHQRANSNA
jgi:hypothetical protein